MFRRFVLSLLPLVALLVAVASFPALAQERVTEVERGAGLDVNVPVAPGLEQRSPRDLTEEDIQLFVPEEKTVGRISIPDEALATLVQPQGRDWRAFRMEWLQWGGAILILGTLLALGIFYFMRGTVRIESGRSGRWVPRFNSLDRFAHWTTATSFIILAITGVIITFGRYVLIPIMGHFAFEPLVDGAKYLHNFAMLPFTVGLVLMLVLWIKDNIPNRSDITWVKEMGGMFRKGGSSHPETERFNAGQKIVFWVVILGGFVMIFTGLTLMMPFFWADVNQMQIAHVVHAVLGMVLIAAILGHIYIGTIGMEGAFDAMGKGKVDENWAIEHHRGWYEKLRRSGRAPPRTEHPAE